MPSTKTRPEAQTAPSARPSSSDDALSGEELLDPLKGADLGAVRANGQRSQDVGARAFALGSEDLQLAPDQGKESKEGKELLAHELAHVVQQTGSRGADTSVQR